MFNIIGISCMFLYGRDLGVDILNYISDFGLILDVIGIVFLAKYAIPSKVLYPDGTDVSQRDLGKERKEKNKDDYKYNRKRTYLGYTFIGIGFILQTKALQEIIALVL